MQHRFFALSLAATAALALGSACSSSPSSAPATTAPTTAAPTTTTTAAPTTTKLANGIPVPDHVVVVVEENHAESAIIGNAQAPYINSLATGGTLFTQSFATHHPSEPNYLALFSGSNQGVVNDDCPPPGSPYSAPNLGANLIAAGKTFTGYSEDLPSPGSDVCANGSYQRKHNPWVDFSNVPAASNQPFTAFPTTDYSGLPKVSFVVPNQQHDMHDGTVEQADTWLKSNLDGYAQWAKTHNSLLIVTWDEDDFTQSNQIPTIFVGPMVKTGQDATHITHYNVLRTLEDMYGAAPSGEAANATPITDCWS